MTKPQANDLASRALLLRIHGGTPQPFGDSFPQGGFEDAYEELKTSLNFAKGLRAELALSPEAAELWKAMYVELRRQRNAGTMIDITTERAERHVLRLAGLYAVGDQSPEIKSEHLLAALAVWDLHEETSRELFWHQTGNKKQNAILYAMRERQTAGMTTDEINRMILQGNTRGGAGPILEELEHAGLIYFRTPSRRIGCTSRSLPPV